MADAGRVIGGAARGVRLEAPGEGTRPFGDRVKESLFGSLETDPAEPAFYTSTFIFAITPPAHSMNRWFR